MLKILAKVYAFANVRLGCQFTRNTLESQWLDNFVCNNCYNKRVLSVGTAWDKVHLPNLTLPLRFDTVDADPLASRYAITSDSHYNVDLLCSKTKTAGPAKYYDVALVVSTLSRSKVALEKLAKSLKPGGLLLLGCRTTAKSRDYHSTELTLVDKINVGKFTYTTYTKIG